MLMLVSLPWFGKSRMEQYRRDGTPHEDRQLDDISARVPHHTDRERPGDILSDFQDTNPPSACFSDFRIELN